MEKTYIFGHQKPDTDSVVSAIALSHLKNVQGYNTVPIVLGEINNETKYVLDYFNIEEPEYLNDVKLQIKDIDYQKGYYINYTESIYDGYLYMNKNMISTLPIVDDNNKFMGMISMKDIARDQLNDKIYNLHSSYENIIDALHGEEILKYEDEIKGNLLVASFKSTTFIETVNIKKDTILIVGDRHSIIEYAVNEGAKMIIITGGRDIKEKHLEIARNNKVNIIKTPFDSFRVSKVINLCNYITTIMIKDKIIYFDENEYVTEFTEQSNKYKFTSYPIINDDKECLGILRISDIVNRKKKKVILVDHNEYEQSVSGLSEADIIEIVDHHKIGTISTSMPINFRNMPVGSTNTIVYTMYKESNIEIPTDIAGLILSGIISDTILLTSPTTTNVDINAVNDLVKITGLDYMNFGKEMFDAGASIKGKSREELLYTDFKNFMISDNKVGIGQLFTANPDELLFTIAEYVKLINAISIENNYQILALCITDILKNGTYIIYNDSSKGVLEAGFGVKNIRQGHYLENVVSRKKQIMPSIIDGIEKI